MDMGGIYIEKELTEKEEEIAKEEEKYRCQRIKAWGDFKWKEN